MKRQPKQIPIVVLVILLLSGPGLFFLGGGSAPVVAAQSTGDTLTTRTPTSPPATATTRPPTQTATTEAKVWVGRLVSNTLGVTEGQGSIFRVKVDGLVGIPIELLTDDEVITGVSGSKPEYGPYTAEFAPVTAGTWIVNVPSLGASIPVQADNYNLAVIEFVQIPASEATATNLPTPSPTSTTGQVWEGRLARETWGIGAQSSRLLVQVVGLSDYPVQLSTTAQVINTANTGQKPTELGPDVVEFAGLTPSKYIIEPLGLNSRFEVELKPNTETRVEFYPVAQPTATFTPLPPATVAPTLPVATTTPTATATPTDTLSPVDTPTPAVTSGPSEPVTPLPSPTSVTQWIGTIAQRQDTGSEAAYIVARVLGIEGLPIRLQASNSNVERRCITGQDGAGQDACILKNLAPGLYIVSPEGLEQSLPVTVYENEKVEVVFDIGILPPGIAGWEARINKNTNGPQAVSKSEGTIRVRVEGRVGQVVALNSARGAERYCEVVPNPVLGSLVCEFGQLRPGVYSVEALNTKASQRLFVDGAGLAEVQFLPSAGPATLAQVQSPIEVGVGALPNRPTVTATPPGQTIIATAPPPRPTATLTATPAPSPTPAFSWQGRVVETVDNVAGAIGVRAAGLKDHPVILQSGSWQSPAQLTGTKPELGDYATEFGGLAQGEYTVELVDLAELTVTLGPDQFLLVEFRYDFVNPPQ